LNSNLEIEPLKTFASFSRYLRAQLRNNGPPPLAAADDEEEEDAEEEAQAVVLSLQPNQGNQPNQEQNGGT